MAITCPTGFDTDGLRREVRAFYGRLADAPDGDFHFHRGAAYAAERLGYDPEAIAALPAEAAEAFAGVGNPLALHALSSGEVVVDVGCGGGLDLLLAARRVGPSGRAIGVDMTAAMRARCQAAAEAAGLGAIVDVRDGDAEALPVEDGVVDVVISNGVLNLATDKRRAFAEILRVLRPGGRLQLADIVLGAELSAQVRGDIDLWTA